MGYKADTFHHLVMGKIRCLLCLQSIPCCFTAVRTQLQADTADLSLAFRGDSLANTAPGIYTESGKPRQLSAGMQNGLPGAGICTDPAIQAVVILERRIGIKRRVGQQSSQPYPGAPCWID